MAIESGKLQNLVFDNQVLESHRAMAAVLGVILKLPPTKQIMASRQMKSRYLLINALVLYISFLSKYIDNNLTKQNAAPEKNKNNR